MPDIPPEAFTSGRRAFIAHIGLHPSNVSEESLEAVDEAIAAAAPALAAAERERFGVLSPGERDLVLADFGQLLETLGLGNHARPQSPHEVFQMALGEVRSLCVTLRERAARTALLSLAAEFERKADEAFSAAKAPASDAVVAGLVVCAGTWQVAARTARERATNAHTPPGAPVPAQGDPPSAQEAPGAPESRAEGQP